MTTPHTPLVCRPRPYPDEALLSYVIRLQVANGYEALVWLTEWLRDQMKARTSLHLTATNQVVFLENLATVTTIPVATLYQLTLNRYLPHFTLPDTSLDYQPISSGQQVAFPLTRQSLKRWSRNETSALFCPHCLNDALYYRLPWSLLVVFACLKHRCWLLDACHVCGAGVPVAAVLKGECPNCLAVLATMPTVTLDDTVYKAQHTIISCLQTSTLPSHTLPPLPISALFRVLEGLAAISRPLGWNWEGCYQPAEVTKEVFSPPPHNDLSPVQLGGLYTSAWLALDEWPEGFYKFIDRYRDQLDIGSLNITQNFGLLYNVWLERLWRHPDFDPIQQAFEDYLVNHLPLSSHVFNLRRFKQNPELGARMKWIPIRQAAYRLGVVDVTIIRMVRDGYIRAHYPQGQSGEGQCFVYQDDLEQAWQQRSTALTTGQVVRRFFSTHAIVNEWIEQGLISQTGSRMVRGIEQPSFIQDDVDDFLDRLTQRIHLVTERPANAKTLKQVCISNNKVRMTATGVLQRVLAGKLPAYHPDPHLLPFNQLWFHPDDVASLMEQVKSDSNWIALRELPAILKVGLDPIRRCVAAGILVPVASMSRRDYFDRDAVYAFQKRLLRTKQVAVILETHENPLRLWTRAGYIPLLSNHASHEGKTYLFDREVIDQWHSQFITHTAVQQILGASSYKVFYKRIVDEVYPSPVPSDMIPKFYYRSALEQFQADLEQQL